jgi:tetratricopeptide (TPR) repeat protein
LRLLAVFLVICVLMLAVVAWELVQLSRTPRTRAAAGPATNVAVDLSSRPTVSGKQDSVATAVEPQPAAQSPVGSDQAESPLGGPPAASQAAVNWASQPELRHAQQRLAAAREALAVDRSNPVALRDALMALRALERWPEACRVLARLVEVEPEEVGLRFEYASTLMRLSRWVDAVHALQVVVEREPDHAQAWYNLGIAHQALGHLEDARRAWNRTIELMPDNPDAYAHRGELLLDYHEWSVAAADFEAVLQRDPNDIDSALNLSLALWKLERLGDACRQVAGVLERHPRHVPALNRMAELCWASYQAQPLTNRTRLDQAIAYCRRSLEIDPNQPAIKALSNQALVAGEGE